MKLIISNIKWDTDGKHVDHLPSTVTINDPSEELLDDLDGYSEAITDYLSDTYGYCVFGYVTDLVSE